MRDYQPLTRERIAEILAWIIVLVFIVIGLNIYGILSARAGDRPSNCPPRAWCGCWMANQVGVRDPQKFKELWRARNWVNFGLPASRGCVGCIAVLTRGKTGGHVGFVQGYEGKNPIIKSGNHNGAVGTGVYDSRRVLAYRYP